MSALSKYDLVPKQFKKAQLLENTNLKKTYIIIDGIEK